MSEFFPLNELEVGLVAAQKKAISVEEFIRKLILSDLVLPSAGEVKEDGSGFQPIFFDKVGTKMLAAFTDKTRALQLEHIAEYYLAINALEVLRRIP